MATTNRFARQVPKNGRDIADDLNSPRGNIAKSELAKVIHDSEIQIESQRLILDQYLQKQQELEQLLYEAKKELEESRPQNPDNTTSAMEALYQDISERIEALKNELHNCYNNLRRQFTTLQQLKAFDPVAISYLNKINSPSANKNTATLRTIMQSSNFQSMTHNQVSPAQQQLLQQRFNNLCEASATVLEREARYRSSLKQAGISNDRDYHPTNSSNEAKEQANEKNLRRKALSNVMLEEFNFVKFVADIIVENNPDKSYPMAMLEANSLVKSGMFSQELEEKVKHYIDTYDEQLVNESAEDLANTQSDHSENMVVRLRMVHSAVKEVDEEVEKTMQVANQLGEQQDLTANYLSSQLSEASLNTPKSSGS